MEAPPNFQGYNPNSQSVRRILREYKEMSQETSTLFRAVPLDVRLIYPGKNGLINGMA
jgi:hypothetical protein